MGARELCVRILIAIVANFSTNLSTNGSFTMRLSALIASICVASAFPASAAVQYTFSGFFGEAIPEGQSNYTAQFSVVLPDFVSSNTTVLAEQMTCSTHASPCTQADFYTSAAAEGFSDNPDWQALVLSTDLASSYYYFNANDFATLGVHASIFPDISATLEVSAVPELSSSSYIVMGLSAIAALCARKRSSAKLSLPV